MNWLRAVVIKHRGHLLVLGSFVALACLYWWPLPAHLLTHTFEQQPRDSAFTQWIMAWDTHALLHYPRNFFEANMFYPFKHVLAWGDNLFGITLLALPLWPFFGLVGTYNVLFILSGALCAFTLYLLVQYLTKNRPAAILAGALWGFWGGRVAQHFHVSILFWVPLIFLHLEKFRRDKHRRNLVWAAVFTFLTLIINVYVAIYLLLAIGFYLASLLALRQLNLKQLQQIVVGLGLSIIGSLPLYLPSILLNLRHPIERGLVQFSSDLTGVDPIASGGRLHSILTSWGAKLPDINMSALSLVVVVLTIVAVIKILRSKLTDVAAYWGFLVIGVLALILALGPNITWNGHILVANPLHRIFYNLVPGYKVFRVPARWLLYAVMTLSLLAGVGFAAITHRWQPGSRYILMACLLGWLILEQFPVGLKVYPSYKFSDYPAYQWLAKQPGEFAIYEYPTFTGIYDFNNDAVEGKRLILSTHTWKKRVSGAFEPHITAGYIGEVSLLNSLGDNPEALARLRQIGVRYVIFVPADFKTLGLPPDLEQHKKDQLDHLPGLQKYKEFPDATVYRVL